MSKVLSVIIPTRNVMETGKLRDIFERIPKVSNSAGLEVLVSDYKSNDGLEELVKEFDFVRLIQSPKMGTAKQINYGLSLATGEYVLIHHARSVLSDYESVLKLCEKGDYDWMYFPLEFDHDHWFLKYFVAPLSTYLRPGLRGAVYWDQCNVVRMDYVKKVGGVPVMDLMEDVEFSKKIRSVGLKPKLIRNVRVLTSAHRFLKNGIYRQHWRNFYIKTAYWLGWKTVDELDDMYK